MASTQDSLARGARRALTSACVYASQARLSVKLSFSRETLRGALKCQFLIVFVPTSRSQVVCPGHAWALARFVPPPVVRAASAALSASMALCRLVSEADRSAAVA